MVAKGGFSHGPSLWRGPTHPHAAAYTSTSGTTDSRTNPCASTLPQSGFDTSTWRYVRYLQSAPGKHFLNKDCDAIAITIAICPIYQEPTCKDMRTHAHACACGCIRVRVYTCAGARARGSSKPPQHHASRTSIIIMRVKGCQYLDSQWGRRRREAGGETSSSTLNPPIHVEMRSSKHRYAGT